MDESASRLRSRAEELINCSPPLSSDELHSIEARDLIYELNVHQAELEMQNDELRRTQQKLMESADRFSELFELAPVAYLTVNSAGLITEANVRASELFELARAEIIGSSIAGCFSSESTDQDQLYFCLKDAHRGQRIAYELELKLGLKSRHVRMDAISARNGGAESGLLRVVITDITEQKQNALIKAEHLQAVQQEKIRALGVIAGGVAHDFNNLLTPIMMHAGMAVEDQGINASTKMNLNCITKSVEDAANLCKTLFEFTGSSQFVHQPISIVQLVNDQIESLTALAPSNVSLVFELDETVANFLGEPSKIRRILVNLISNAIEAIEDGAGTITIGITAKNFTKADLLRLTYATNTDAGHFICISITDNGCGMDEETKSSLFAPYFSCKTAGRGLGMSAVMGIINEHGAAIDVSTRESLGTAIVCLFPKTDRTPVLTESHADVDFKGSGTVLIVDDDPMVRESFVSLLDFSGFSTHVVTSGKEAIEFMQSTDFPIDVVLLDLVMPEMNGVETLVAIREIEPSMPVVIVSGYAEDEMVEAVNSHVVQGFITKPCSISRLTEAIKTAIKTKV